MSFEPGKGRCDLGSAREESGEYLRWDSLERKFVSLPIQRVDDFVEAHEITDQGQVFTIACLIRVCECAGDDAADFRDVAHVDATHSGIDGKRPAQRAVLLLLRSHKAHQ